MTQTCKHGEDLVVFQGPAHKPCHLCIALGDKAPKPIHKKSAAAGLLTPGELRIAKLIAEEGLDTRQIAKSMGITIWSVRHYTTVILNKTGCKRMAHAIYVLAKDGLI